MRLLILLMLGLSGSTVLCAQELITRPDEQLLIMTVKLNTEQLHEGMVTYLDGQTFYLPLSEFVAALGLPIDVQYENAYAEGWFKEENHRFVLDLKRQILNIGGLPQTVDWARVEYHDFDIYIDSEQLMKWFGLKFDTLINALVIRLEPGQWLPLEERIKRHKQWERVASQQPLTVAQGATGLANPSRWVSWPVLDNTLRVGLIGRGDDHRLQYQYDLLGTGDLLRLSSTYSFNVGRTSSAETAINSRLQLFNQPASAQGTQVVLGDYTTPSIPLLTQQQDGVGLMVGNFSQTQSIDFDRVGITGDALNGWDVELYRNNELIDFQTVAEDNRYAFDNIPIQYGLNLFRLVLYGPEGQRREQLREFVVGEDMVPAGRTQWVAAANVNGRRLIPGQRDFVLNAVDDETAVDRLQGTLAFRYGLSGNWSLAASVNSLPVNGTRRRQIASLSLQTGRASGIYDLTLAGDLQGGFAARIIAQVLGQQQNWQAEYSYFDRFVSPLFATEEAGERIQHRVQLRWSGRLGARDPWTVETRYVRRESGVDEWRNELRYAHRFSRISLGSSLIYNYDERQVDRLSSSLLLSYRGDVLDLNGQLNYELTPRNTLRSANLTGNWRRSKSLTLRANLRKGFEEDASDNLSVSASWQLPKWILSLSAEHDFSSDYRLSLSLFSSLSRAHRHWRLNHRSKSGVAIITARVFLDQNGNGYFDAQDEALPNVRFRINSGQHRARSGDDGLAVLDDITAGDSLSISIAENSLEDPYWLPAQAGYQIRMRPGQSRHLSFPVVQSAEVDGTVWLLKHGKKEPAANVQLELLNSQGAVIKSTKTAYDGFYLLDQLRPGNYQLRIAKQQLARLSLKVDRDYRLSLSENGDVKSGTDFVIEMIADE